MTDITQDADDPGQPRRPDYVPLTGVQVLQQHIEPVLRFVQPAIVAYQQRGQDIEKNLTAFMLYAFVAETGMKPSECTLVMKKIDNNAVESYFVPKTAHQRHVDLIDGFKAEIRSLRKRVDDLEQENRDLRWKR